MLPPIERMKARHETIVPAHRPATPAVVGARRDGEGWRVLLFAGELGAIELTAERARGLAGDLQTMADVIEGKRW